MLSLCTLPSMTDPVIWLPYVVFFTSALVQGIAGFGGSLVAMALLPLVWEIRTAVGVSTVFGIVLTMFLAFQLRAHMQRAEIVPMVVAGAVGVPLGVSFLHGVEVRWVIATLGVILLVHAGWSLVGHKAGARVGRWAAPLAGFVGGMLSGAFSTAGPPALMYATARNWPRDTFRANLQAFFLSTSTFSLVGFVMTDVVTLDTMRINLTLLPALALGGWLGHRISGRIDQERFRRGVLVALLLMGCNYLFRAL
jgi:uncharacterized protein